MRKDPPFDNQGPEHLPAPEPRRSPRPIAALALAVGMGVGAGMLGGWDLAGTVFCAVLTTFAHRDDSK